MRTRRLSSPSAVPGSLTSARWLAGLVAGLACLVVGCGGTTAPHVDPRPLSDGGIPDRVLQEAGALDARDGAGGDGTGVDGDNDGEADLMNPDAVGGPDSGDGPEGDQAAGDATPLDGAGSDAGLLATTMAVDIVDPQEGALQVAMRRFAPLVSVVLTTDPSRVDDVKQVDVELWSTGTVPAKISSTRLAQLNKTGAGAGGAGPGGNSGGAGGADSSGGQTGGGGGGTATGTPGTGGTSPTSDGGGDDVVTETPPPPSNRTALTYGDTPVDLSSLATDTYELRLTVVTLAGVSASSKRRIRVDAGPTIRVIAPVPDQAARGSIFVSVEVIDPYSSTPPTVTISVANLPVTPLTAVGSLFQATVAETIANPPLSGAQLLDVGAVNAAGVAARHVTVRFIFDDLGPAITGGRPTTGSLIGGIVKLETDIVDPAGVDTNTVVAVVAHGDTSLEVKLDQDPNDKKHFAHLFDTRRLSNTVLYPTISFRASDLPGNQSSIGYTVAVDNTPPLADLDPPADLRLRRFASEIWRCSWEFDPLGADAVNDGDSVLQLFDIRARVQDEGNRPVAGGADITPLAGLDASHVELFVLDDTTRALVVDTDGDGLCDAINPKLIPTTTPMSSQDALLVNLAPVPPTGAADFTPDLGIPPAGLSDCIIGNETSRPLTLCRTTSMTVAIPAHQTTEAGVWTIPKVVPSTPQCVGNQLDSLGNHLQDGPACLAVHAIDNLGNSQVSRILHVCIDHDGDGVECPFAPLVSVAGGAPVRITTAAPHGLATGDRVLVGRVPTLFDANGLWSVTVVSSTELALVGSSTPATVVSGGQFMRWSYPSDCTGAQTSLNPVVVDDTRPCTPWRRYSRGEHIETN